MIKGFIVRCGNNVYKAGLPDNGLISLEFVLRSHGSFWRTDGLSIEENKRLCWNSSPLKLGDEIEIELAEFAEASKSLGEIYDSHEEAMTQVYIPSEADRMMLNLEQYYLLEKILKEENLI